MAHARQEYGIIIALLGVLVAIGVPALRRDQIVIGGVCIGLAVATAVWSVVAIRRARR